MARIIRVTEDEAELIYDGAWFDTKSVINNDHVPGELIFVEGDGFDHPALLDRLTNLALVAVVGYYREPFLGGQLDRERIEVLRSCRWNVEDGAVLFCPADLKTKLAALRTAAHCAA